MRAAAVVAAGALPFALGVETAAADESFAQFFSTDHTFTTGTGARVTCTFSGESRLSRPTGQDTFGGEALTRAAGEHPACGITFVEVLVTYVDGSGRQRSTGADSVDGDVRWFGNDVLTEFRVVHRARFDDCTSDCQVSFTTSPK